MWAPVVIFGSSSNARELILRLLVLTLFPSVILYPFSESFHLTVSLSLEQVFLMPTFIRKLLLYLNSIDYQHMTFFLNFLFFSEAIIIEDLDTGKSGKFFLQICPSVGKFRLLFLSSSLCYSLSCTSLSDLSFVTRKLFLWWTFVEIRTFLGRISSNLLFTFSFKNQLRKLCAL